VADRRHAPLESRQLRRRLARAGEDALKAAHNVANRRPAANAGVAAMSLACVRVVGLVCVRSGSWIGAQCAVGPYSRIGAQCAVAVSPWSWIGA